MRQATEYLEPSIHRRDWDDDGLAVFCSGVSAGNR